MFCLGAFANVLGLLKYHINLLRTGTLTKEDSGPLSPKVSAAYSTFKMRGNVQLAFRGMREPRILQKFIKAQNALYKLVKENPLLNSFDAIGRTLKMA